jgi:hypothetical protein
VGSLLADRQSDPVRLVRVAGVALPLYLVFFLAIGAKLLDVTLGWPFALRAIITIALVAPLGALMGMFFPSGLRVAARQAPELVAWGWGINAGFTVLGSIGAIVAALAVGFTRVLVASAGLYVVAALCLLRFAKAARPMDAAHDVAVLTDPLAPELKAGASRGS